jgi:hypothetical protein
MAIGASDWQSSENYTLSLTSSDWAWEFVRRNPQLRTLAMSLSRIETETSAPSFHRITIKEVPQEIGHFGLLFF